MQLAHLVRGIFVWSSLHSSLNSLQLLLVVTIWAEWVWIISIISVIGSSSGGGLVDEILNGGNTLSWLSSDLTVWGVVVAVEVVGEDIADCDSVASLPDVQSDLVHIEVLEVLWVLLKVVVDHLSVIFNASQGVLLNNVWAGFIEVSEGCIVFLQGVEEVIELEVIWVLVVVATVLRSTVVVSSVVAGVVIWIVPVVAIVVVVAVVAVVAIIVVVAVVVVSLVVAVIVVIAVVVVVAIVAAVLGGGAVITIVWLVAVVLAVLAL